MSVIQRRSGPSTHLVFGVFIDLKHVSWQLVRLQAFALKRQWERVSRSVPLPLLHFPLWTSLLFVKHATDHCLIHTYALSPLCYHFFFLCTCPIYCPSEGCSDENHFLSELYHHINKNWKHLGCTCCAVEENVAELCAVTSIRVQYFLYSAESGPH